MPLEKSLVAEILPGREEIVRSWHARVEKMRAEGVNPRDGDLYVPLPPKFCDVCEITPADYYERPTMLSVCHECRIKL